MKVIDPSPSYSQGNESEFRLETYQAIRDSYSTNRDLFIGMSQRLCIQSPDGTWWRLAVDDGGAVTTEAVTP